MANLNIDAEKSKTYDAIVIGSGVAGGWAAKELTEKGLKVIMLERGKPLEHITGYSDTNKDPWEYEHRGRITVEQAKERLLAKRHAADDEQQVSRQGKQRHDGDVGGQADGVLRQHGSPCRERLALSTAAPRL